ncbi:DUF1643 domain-containing protein [Novosphingobium bradum]|uniref:DUF1643 domain-containing protein n=1 Tax=Novosphingobium bradum TaxID=1737444 RepID=A0ABV7IVN1_9SPHN
MEKTATISACGQYRYSLTREWGSGPRVLFVMLNPSTADHLEDDPTIGRCISFAKSWGYGSLAVGNLFAFRTPSPAVLFTAPEPVGPENDEWLGRLSGSADLTVAAWGNNGSHLGRSKAVLSMLVKPHYLRLTGAGEPSHPLYLPADLKTTAFAAAASAL